MVETPSDDPSLRYGILGPLRAWQGERELDLGAAKQRALLAVLLLNANKPVPTAHLIDAVWRDDPPRNGPNVVQKYVAGLRRVLEPNRSVRAPGQLLTLTDAGYLLRVGPDCLDADLFRRRLALGRAMRAENRLAEAAEELRAAVEMWRATALAGLSGPLFEAARDRLAEDRATALESWAEVELERGHHAEIVGELVRLVAEFPLREQPRYLLILALYRCGRQAESLAAFRDTRSFLADEFGVEPGQRLQHLHMGVLRGDPALAAPGGPAPGGGPRRTPADLRSGAPAAFWAAGPAEAAVSRTRQPVTAATPAVPAHEAGIAAVTDPYRTPDSGARRRRVLARFLGVSIALVSFGMASWAVVAFFAARRRSGALAVAAVGYFALIAVFLLSVSYNPNLDGPLLVTDVIGLLALTLAWFGGAVHAALLDADPPRQRPDRTTPRSPAADLNAQDGRHPGPPPRHEPRHESPSARVRTADTDVA